MDQRARDLDSVKLLRPLDGWASGTRGTVVAEGFETALVEVSTEHLVDAEGLPLRDLFEDFVDVPYEELEVVRRPDLSTP